MMTSVRSRGCRGAALPGEQRCWDHGRQVVPTSFRDWGRDGTPVTASFSQLSGVGGAVLAVLAERVQRVACCGAWLIAIPQLLNSFDDLLDARAGIEGLVHRVLGLRTAFAVVRHHVVQRLLAALGSGPIRQALVA